MTKRKPKHLHKKLGRPLYSEAVRRRCLLRFSRGESWRSICRRPGYPSWQTIWRWVDSDPAFRERYARAKEVAAERLLGDLVPIADGVDPDSKAGVLKGRLQVDARRYVLEKLAPTKYGREVETRQRVEVVRLDWSPFTGSSGPVIDAGAVEVERLPDGQSGDGADELPAEGA